MYVLRVLQYYRFEVNKTKKETVHKENKQEGCSEALLGSNKSNIEFLIAY